MRSINRSQRNHNVLKQKQKLIGGEINIEICPFPTKINVNQSDANLHFACSVSPVAWELSFWVRVSDRGTYLQLARFVNELYCRPSALSRVSPELRAVRDWCAAADMIHCPASGGWCCLACFVGGSEALSKKKTIGKVISSIHCATWERSLTVLFWGRICWFITTRCCPTVGFWTPCVPVCGRMLTNKLLGSATMFDVCA